MINLTEDSDITIIPGRLMEMLRQTTESNSNIVLDESE